MKKIIRIASVIALASASLLYVGCTKDFSADLAKTNSEVAAQASKVAALEATVQTINSTVENLKTTKADAAAVNALKEDLESKINTLTSALEQTALLAASAKADAEAVAADLEVEKARLDTVIAAVELIADASDSLRKDVDSLYKNSADLSERIDELEEKVSDLAARVTSVVALPAAEEEIKFYQIDTFETVGLGQIDTAFFAGKFAFAPKTAEISAENLKLIVKHGITKDEAEPNCIKDTVYEVASVSVKDGIATVFAGVEGIKDECDADAPTNAPYFALAFTATDKNGEYTVVSDFVKARVGVNQATLADVITVLEKKTGEKIPAETSFSDTIAYNAGKTAFKSFADLYEVKAKFQGGYVSLAEFAKAFGTTAAKLAIDTIQKPVDSLIYINDARADVDSLLPVPAHDYNSITQFYNSNNGRTKEEPEWFAYVYKNPSRPYSDETRTNRYNEYKDWRTKKSNGISYNKDTYVFTKTANLNGSYFGNTSVAADSIKVSGSTVLAVINETHVIGRNTSDFAYTISAGKEGWYWDQVFAEDNFEKAYAQKLNKASHSNAADLEVSDAGVTFTLVKATAGSDNVNLKVKGNIYNFTSKDTTYNVVFALSDPSAKITSKTDTTAVSYKWSYKVGPRPADPELIKFAKDTTVVGRNNLAVAFDIKKASVAAVKELDDRATINTSPEVTAVTFDGEAIAEKVLKDFTVTDGKVNIKEKHLKSGSYVITAEATNHGIKFTYEFTINVTKGKTPKFKALTAYLKVEGDKSFSAEIAAPKIDTTTNKGSQGNYVENLNTLKFNQYFIVDTTEASCAGLAAVFGQLDTTASKAMIVMNQIDVNADKVTFGDGAFAWKSYDSLAVNVAAYLVVTGEVQDTIDQVNIKFWTADPIKSVVAKNVTVKHDPTKSDKVDLDSLFVIKDFVDSTVWNENGIVANRTYNYGQTIVYGADSTWTFTGGTTIKNQITLDRASNVLTLAAQGATIENAISVEIPFTVKHDLDKFGVAAEDRQGTVKVTFTK